MFKINELIMYNLNGDKSYSYKFECGINYFIGANSTGKTEFYLFLDFMFGADNKPAKKEIYKNSWNKAIMIFDYNETKYVAIRTRRINENYFGYVQDIENLTPIDHAEYREKLNSVFAQNIQELKDIREFTGEELSYRTFTMFNFLSESNQGDIQDFFSKCKNVRYSVKLNPILNYIFNNNIQKIFSLQNELNRLTVLLKEQEKQNETSIFIIKRINNNIRKLEGSEKQYYTGNNKEEIRKFISSVMNMDENVKKDNNKNIADLEVMYNSLTEQIKVYETNIRDAKQFKKESENRKYLLQTLDNLINQQSNMEYLVEPIKNLITEVEGTIFFSNYIITDKTIAELKKQRENIKKEIINNDSKFKCYSLEEKKKAIAVIEDYLEYEVTNNTESIKEIKKKIREIKEEIKALQNSDDINKINNISNIVTNLYTSASGISDIISVDTQKKGFEIKYIKKGNILQPQIIRMENEEQSTKENYYTGSLARHTLIQLCGYLAFMEILLKEDKYPLIPILVIDHISKPFDMNNAYAIGTIIETAYKAIGIENMQIFIFDDQDSAKLNLHVNHSENLVTSEKTGFNPFFKPIK